MSERNDEEMFENMEDLIKVRKKALKLTVGWHIINTSGTIDQINRNIDEILNQIDNCKM